MISLHRILVPLDLSADSEAVLRYAVFYAEHWGARVDVLHAVPEAWRMDEEQQKEEVTHARERITALLEGIGSATALRGGIEVTVGDPVTAILRAAPKYNLVIMGRPRHPGVSSGVAAAVGACVPCVFSPLPARRDTRPTERTERATPVSNKSGSSPSAVSDSAH
jgi:nucleotide-binding universal stress UspA family protein